MPDQPVYFENAAALTRWFAKNASTAPELVVGFMKTSTDSPSVTWPEAVDEALCVGWIDGVRHRIDDERYKVRFTPRKPGSNWSTVNLKRVPELHAEGRMQAAGSAAFERRTESKSRTASYEQRTPPELDAKDIKVFKRIPGAWAYYESLPAGYRRTVTWWVISAKQLSTRDKRLASLIQACAERKRL